MRKAFFLATAISLLLGGFLLWPEETKRTSVVSNDQKYVAAEGRISVKPDRRAVLAAEVPGRISEIYVDNLSPVKKGDILAVLSNNDMEHKISETEASYRKAEASYSELHHGSRREDVDEAEALLHKAEADLDLAQRNEDRDSRLADEGVISQSQLDATTAQLKKAQSELDASRERYDKVVSGPRTETVQAATAEVAAQKSALDSLKASYDKTYVRSPLNGIVIQRYRNASEFADAGDPILEVADLSEIIIDAEVNETDAGKVTSNQKVIVTSDAFPGRKFSGQVYEVSAALRKRASEPDDPAVVVDQKVLPVKVKFLQTVPLKLGMKVDLKIIM